MNQLVWQQWKLAQEGSARKSASAPEQRQL
jgi:hypothetical protein